MSENGLSDYAPEFPERLSVFFWPFKMCQCEPTFLAVTYCDLVSPGKTLFTERDLYSWHSLALVFMAVVGVQLSSMVLLAADAVSRDVGAGMGVVIILALYVLFYAGPGRGGGVLHLIPVFLPKR